MLMGGIFSNFKKCLEKSQNFDINVFQTVQTSCLMKKLHKSHMQNLEGIYVEIGPKNSPSEKI